MNMTLHAQLRSQQRAISPEEFLILMEIRITIEQKSGTSIVTVAKQECNKWISVLKEVLALLRATRVVGEYRSFIKRKIKAIRKLINHLQSEHLPYFVINNEEYRVITCGHCSQRIKRN
jgi:hypothetical protein